VKPQKAKSEPQNSRMSNVEGWNRSRSAGTTAAPALARCVRRVSFIRFLKLPEFIPSTFDIHYSIFDIRF
jgi:hypothetical protein